MLWWREKRLIILFVPAIVLYLAFMGTQGRYYGRWLLPIFPLVCLLSAFCVLELARRAGESRRHPRRDRRDRRRVRGPPAWGAVYSYHSSVVLSRADTRNEVRAWMVAHIPVGSHIVVEPFVPATWVQDPGMPSPTI